ncbi:MAG: SRPBCC family protein, partial [Acidimicrobiales bacterium]
YLGRTTHVMAEKLRVVERGSDMVLAEHYTAVGTKRVVTLETVRFERPHLVSFRLVRGPVPEVTETFSLSEERGITTLRYEGELGTDGGRLGAQWGVLVARQWEKAVDQALASVKKESERVAGRRSSSGAPGNT